MDDNDIRIVKVTNITDFDFTPDMGAMYGGRAFAIPVGRYLLAPFTIGDHLATHMARQILLRKAPTRDDPNELDGKGKNLPLWSEEAITDLKKRILSDAYVEDKPQTLSQDEAMARRIAELNVPSTGTSSAPVGGNTEVPPELVPTDPNTQDSTAGIGGNTAVPTAAELLASNHNGQDTTAVPAPVRTKADVITELTARGVKFDARAPKADLEKLLGEPAASNQNTQV